MNKLLTAALLSLIGLGMATEQASAGWCRESCRERYSNRYRVIVHKSQYNAFSPFCVDSVRYKGHFSTTCNPNQFGAGCDGNECNGNACSEGGFMGSLPQQAPSPAPMPSQVNPGHSMMMAPANGNFAGYQPQMYQPGYSRGY